MPIRRKPTSVDAFIQGGGKEPTPAESSSDKRPIQPLKLRVPADLLEEIDAAVVRRRPAPSRHQWILEAIYEKLEREG